MYLHIITHFFYLITEQEALTILSFYEGTLIYILGENKSLGTAETTNSFIVKLINSLKGIFYFFHGKFPKLSEMLFFK